MLLKVFFIYALNIKKGLERPTLRTNLTEQCDQLDRVLLSF